MDPFEKVRDSSVWLNPDSMSLNAKKDPYIRTGIILKTMEDKDAGEIKYLVEVKDKNDTITAWCRAMTGRGGVYNYEEWSMRGYTRTPLTSLADFAKSKAGDFVLVAFLNGETREGVILGGLKHPGRTSKLKADEDPAYNAEFNGVETKINKDGEWTLTFKGIPINAALLKAPATGVPIIPPIYNPVTGGSYMKFDKTGSWELNDKAIALPQSIKVDKSGGTMTLTSGLNVFKMDKAGLATSLETGKFTVNSKISMDFKTIQYSVDATASIKLKALKIAIGTSGIELFDQLIQMIDALGKVQVTSPVGPCTPLMATGGWVAVELIKAKLTLVKGSL